MTNYKVNQIDLLDEIKKNISHGTYKTAYCVIETPVAFVYRESQVDKSKCLAMGYDVYESCHNGGTILGDKGGVAAFHIHHLCNGWREQFAEYFVNWLKAKNLNAEYNNNDILVDGYKVCATCTTSYGRVDYTALYVGVNTNLDNIKALCTKPMVKVPKGLSEYGITTEEIVQMFIDFFEQDNR